MKKINTQIVIMILLLSGLGVLAALDIGGVFSTISDPLIGEEGFEVYDPLIISDSYQNNLWGNPDPAFISVVNEEVVLLGGESFTTTDLYLQDVRFSYESFLGDVNARFLGEGINKINFGNDIINLQNCGPTCQYETKESGFIELRWDDYELGHYQIFKDAELISDGFANSMVLTFIPQEEVITPITIGGDRAQGKIIIKDFRVKRIFGCDTQEGEVIRYEAFRGPTTVDIDDLPGFKRFCLDFPAATINYDGNVAGTSERILFDLAAGESLVINNENNAWHIAYVSEGINGDLTGFANFGDEILVEDEVDLPERDETKGNRGLLWTINYADKMMFSGDNLLIDVSRPTYDCHDNDNHDPNGVIRFPEPSEDCYVWKINDEELVGLSAASIGAWNVDLLDADVRFKYQDNVFVGTEDPSDWALFAELTLVDDLFEVVGYENNNLLISSVDDLEAVINIVYVPEIINNEIVVSKTVDLVSGTNDVSLNLNSDYVGSYDAYINVLLKTNKGNFFASEEFVINYQIDNNNELINDSLSATKLSFWDKIIIWFKGLFNW